MLTESHKHTVKLNVLRLQVHGMGGALGVWWYSLAAKEGFVHELYGEATCSAHSNALPYVHICSWCPVPLLLLGFILAKSVVILWPHRHRTTLQAEFCITDSHGDTLNLFCAMQAPPTLTA